MTHDLLCVEQQTRDVIKLMEFLKDYSLFCEFVLYVFFSVDDTENLF